MVDLLCIRGALLPWSPSVAVLTTSGFIAHLTLDPQRLVLTEPLLHLAECLPYSALNLQAVSMPGGEPECWALEMTARACSEAAVLSKSLLSVRNDCSSVFRGHCALEIAAGRSK